jgi:hypothetical protein
VVGQFFVEEELNLVYREWVWVGFFVLSMSMSCVMGSISRFCEASTICITWSDEVRVSSRSG